MKATNGKRPRKDSVLMVEFRNGWKVGPYKDSALIWRHRGWESDVIAAEYVIEAKDS